MTAVSVIVPVYNGEKYLEKCLDCICEQTLRDIEIICVDDGSTDSSCEIIKRYQEKDDRIKFFQQDHQYAGVARNLGIKHATGEYLAFWDCDDLFDKQALEKLYNEANSSNADVCVCGGNRFSEERGVAYPFHAYLNMKWVPKEETFNRYTNPDHYLDFTTAAVWNKLFKRKYIENLSLSFQPFRNGEDAYFTICALGLADRIAILNERLITYRMNQGNSLTDTHDEDPLSPIQAWIDIAETLENHDGFGERSFANRAVGNMIGLLSSLQDWHAFNQAVVVLKDYGLQKMHILPQQNGYYYNAWNGECVQQLYLDTPEQFALFLAYSRYTNQINVLSDLEGIKGKLSESNQQLKVLKRENDNYVEEISKQEKIITELKSEENKVESENANLRKEISRIRSSWTFKTGKVITWIPGKLKEWFTRDK